MGYPDISNPRHVRSLIDNVYASYISSQDMFPRKRIRIGYEQLPRKTQPVAARLEYSWAVIDDDRAYFLKAVGAAIDRVKKVDGQEQQNMLVATRIGRNAVNIAQISSSPEPSVAISVWPREQFVEWFEGHEFGLVNGGTVTMRGGEVEGSVGGIITRHSNVAGVFGLSPAETIELVSAIGTTPVRAIGAL